MRENFCSRYTNEPLATGLQQAGACDSEQFYAEQFKLATVITTVRLTEQSTPRLLHPWRTFCSVEGKRTGTSSFRVCNSVEHLQQK